MYAVCILTVTSATYNYYSEFSDDNGKYNLPQ